ncbi:MAG: presenilin family intramembrane aspartyl protease [Candidatus Asgardarchaeia archaeon]
MNKRLFFNFIEPLIPIVSSITIASLLTAYLSRATEPIEIVPFEGSSGPGAFMNAIYFMILTLFGGFLILLILRYDMKLLFKLIFGFSLFLSSFILSLYMMILFLPAYHSMILSVTLAIALSTSVISKMVPNFIRNLSVILLSGEVGSFMGFNIPPISTFIILSVLALYDVISVKKGPLKGIVEFLDDQTYPFIGYSSSRVSIGMGDLVFYSMFVSNVMAYFSFLAASFTFFGLLIGIVISFLLLEKRRTIPGLPLPILFGLLFLLLHYILIG